MAGLGLDWLLHGDAGGRQRLGLALAALLIVAATSACCVYYLARALRARRRSTQCIKSLNMYLFKLNVRYRPKGLEFCVHTSSRELLIRKLL